MAYAAVVSLKHTIEQLLNNDETKGVLSLSETMLINNELPHLISFLKTIKSLPNNKIVDPASEKRVKDAVQKLEDLIDSLVSDLLLSESERSISADEISLKFSFSQQLQNVNEEVGSFLSATLPKNINDKDQQQRQQQICRYSSSSEYNTWNQQKNLVVGLDDQIKQLKEWIFNPTPFMSVTTLAGMTGIGKTTLAKQVYIDPLVIEKFEIRLFVHIGPQYSQSEEILLLVLDQLGVVVPSDKLVDRENTDYLTQQLRKALSSKKYLIVLDDVWTNKNVLHTIKYGCFPNNQKGSRVIIVSQIQRYLKQPNVFLLPLLNESKSWKLLHQTAFGNSEEKCSRELEIIGKKIARNCDGLPAAIIHVGENLRGKSFQEWKTLSENEDPLVITRDDDTPLSKALYFSYMMLPQYLKLCFLYMGVFPKYYEIFRSKLIKLWVCEGLLDPEQILGILDAEGTAGKYLDLLICQSVVLREKQTSLDDEISKNCRLHFTFRSLCVTESKSEFCFHILKKFTDCTPENIKGHKRLCVHNNVVLAFPQVHEWMESVPNARSLLCFGPKQKYPIVLPFNLRLLKIIDALAIRFYEFPLQILVLVHLRYFAITCDGKLPNSISRLWNLEILIVCRHHNIKLSNNCPIYLPIEIWKMKKLKQLSCMGFDMPAPPSDDSHLILEMLLTVSGVSVHSCTMEVLSRIPNLKRIAVQIESAHDSNENFSFFSHFASLYEAFESFKCVVVNPNLKSQIVRCIPNFPQDMRKLSLSGCGLPWENMEVIASLPNLTVLKLRWYAFCGPVWKTNEVQFPSLQYLLLEDLDIERWEFDGELFPYLDHVIFRHCYKLKKIQNQLEFVNRVEVDDCSLSFEKKMREWRSTYDTEAKIRSSSTDL